MIGLSGRGARAAAAVLAATAVGLSGCAGPGEPPPTPEPELLRQFADQTPDYVPDGALDSVVLLQDPENEIVGSATVIAPDRVLTAAHVIDDMTRDERGRLVVRVDDHDVVAVVAAAGDPDRPHSDWAVLALDRPLRMRPAVVHEPARQAAWQPAVDQEILLVGYAVGFFPDLVVDLDAPTPAVCARITMVDPTGPCWYAAGDLVHLAGMSGGAVMVWSEEHQRAELIGIFRGYVPTETVRTETTRVLGVAVSSREQRTPGIAFMIHRLPGFVAAPRAAGAPADR